MGIPQCLCFSCLLFVLGCPSPTTAPVVVLLLHQRPAPAMQSLLQPYLVHGCRSPTHIVKVTLQKMYCRIVVVYVALSHQICFNYLGIPWAWQSVRYLLCTHLISVDFKQVYVYVCTYTVLWPDTLLAHLSRGKNNNLCIVNSCKEEQRFIIWNYIVKFVRCYFGNQYYNSKGFWMSSNLPHVCWVLGLGWSTLKFPLAVCKI